MNIKRLTVICILLMASIFATAQTDDAEDRAYVGSRWSDKYHLPTCEWAQKIGQRNVVYFLNIIIHSSTISEGIRGV